MRVEYDVKELKKIISALVGLLHVGAIFFDKDLKPLVILSKTDDYCSDLQKLSYAKKQCAKNDYDLIKKCWKSGKPEYHLCHAGLFDIAVPIVKNGETVGIVELGRIRLKESPEKSKYAFADGAENALYSAIKVFSTEELESLISLLPYLLEGAGITFKEETLGDGIANYIRKNLAENLTVNGLCKRFCVSKNAVYKAIKADYNVTVNEFIALQRMAKAKELLRFTDKSVMAVSEEVGVENYTYFCKWFKKWNGISPNRFRKEEKANLKVT